MARAKGKPVSTAGYFERVFTEHRDWLEAGTNDAVLHQWQVDHPGEALTNNIKASMSNAKSRIRKKLGLGRRRKKRRKHAAAGATVGTAAPAPRARLSVSNLERLEEEIDRCLSMARQQEAEGFGAVIKHLRAARNEVVWLHGGTLQPR